MRKTAITCWIFAVFLVVFGWQFRGPLFWTLGIEGPSLLREITNEGGLTEACLDDHAIIFLNNDRSGNNQVMRNDIDAFARDWQYSRQSPKANFYSIDLTGGAEEAVLKMPFLGSWINSDSRISQPGHLGMGGIIFLRRGIISDVVSDSDYFTSVSLTLTELTKHCFAR